MISQTQMLCYIWFFSISALINQSIRGSRMDGIGRGIGPRYGRMLAAWPGQILIEIHTEIQIQTEIQKYQSIKDRYGRMLTQVKTEIHTTSWQTNWNMGGSEIHLFAWTMKRWFWCLLGFNMIIQNQIMQNIIKKTLACLFQAQYKFP